MRELIVTGIKMLIQGGDGRETDMHSTKNEKRKQQEEHSPALRPAGKRSKLGGARMENVQKVELRAGF